MLSSLTTGPRTGAPESHRRSAHWYVLFASRILGVGPARSRAVEAVRGDVIVLLDADDLLLTEASVASRLRVLEDRPEVDLVFGHVRTFTAEVAADRTDRPRRSASGSRATGSMLLRRVAYERVGRVPGRAARRRASTRCFAPANSACSTRRLPEQVLWRRLHAADSSARRAPPSTGVPAVAEGIA